MHFHAPLLAAALIYYDDGNDEKEMFSQVLKITT